MTTAYTTRLSLFPQPSFGRDLMTNSRSLPPYDPVKGASKSNGPLSPVGKLPGIESLLSPPSPVLPNPRSTELPSPASIHPPAERYPGSSYRRAEPFALPNTSLPPLSTVHPQPLAPPLTAANTPTPYTYSAQGHPPSLPASMHPHQHEGFPYRPPMPPASTGPHEAAPLLRAAPLIPSPSGHPDHRPGSGGHLNATTPVRNKHVREEVIPGEGPCWLYDDGTFVRKEIDGEPVNAQWGITKAGKPRKRLAMACKTCREKKIKCEPADPKCAQCERAGRECRYETARHPRR